VQLARWRQESLQAHPHPDNLVALAWADARARYGIPRQYAEQLLDGVAADIDHLRYQTFEELAHYCYGVASTVGLMSMHIVGYASDDAIPYAIKLGVALQLTNILRDVGEDWQKGRFYLPLEEMAAFGLAEAELPISGDDPRWVAFMQFQIERTRQLYREALPGIGLLDPQGRFAIAAAGAVSGHPRRHRGSSIRCIQPPRACQRPAEAEAAPRDLVAEPLRPQAGAPLEQARGWRQGP
jgi:15-cis-phytoene synthase